MIVTWMVSFRMCQTKTSCLERRITKKNWWADPFITWAFTSFISANDSLVSRIWHSPALKDVFQKYAALLT